MILVMNASAHITTVPVTTPESGVDTEDAELTAVRENEPVTGYDWKNPDTMFEAPIATSSWLDATS